MSMPELPVCQHRGEIHGDRVACRSNRWIKPDGETVPLDVCAQCRYADAPLLNIETLRRPHDSACRHRREALRIQKCDLCGLRGQDVEVFRCSLHGECSIHRQHSEIRSCAACEDRAF